jgi:hypothetical protein
MSDHEKRRMGLVAESDMDQLRARVREAIRAMGSEDVKELMDKVADLVEKVNEGAS